MVYSRFRKAYAPTEKVGINEKFSVFNLYVVITQIRATFLCKRPQNYFTLKHTNHIKKQMIYKKTIFVLA